MQIGHGHFRRRHEKQIVGRRLVGLLLELRDLPRALHRLAFHDERRLHLDVSVLSRVEIEHEADQRAHQLRSRADEYGEPGSGDLRAAREVEHAQALANLPVGLPTSGGGRAPRAYDGVVRCVTVGEIRERNVGHEQAFALEVALDAAELGLERRDALAQDAPSLAQVGRERSLLFHQARVGFRGLVALRLELIELSGEGAAPHVQRLELVEQPHHGRVAAPGERGTHLLGRGAQELEVDHRLTASERLAPGRGTRNSGRRGSRSPRAAPSSPRAAHAAWHTWRPSP